MLYYLITFYSINMFKISLFDYMFFIFLTCTVKFLVNQMLFISVSKHEMPPLLYRYQEYMSGQAAIHCPQNSGFFLISSLCIQVLVTHIFLLKRTLFKMHITQKLYVAVSKVHVSNRHDLHYTKYRKNVILLSLGLLANVLFIWEEICQSNHRLDSITKTRVIQ